MSWRVRLIKDFDFLGGRLIAFRSFGPREQIEYISAVQRKVVEVGYAIPDDAGFFRGHPEEIKEFLQSVVDAAWEEGIKPSKLEDFANELRATKYHLEDMRYLASARKDRV